MSVHFHRLRWEAHLGPAFADESRKKTFGQTATTVLRIEFSKWRPVVSFRSRHR